MPSLPTNYRISEAEAGYVRSQAQTQCPYSLQTLVQDWGGSRKRVTISVPPIGPSEAADWSGFFRGCNGMVNTFDLDVSDLYPDETGVGAVTFRLADPNFRYNINNAQFFGFSFDAIEVL